MKLGHTELHDGLMLCSPLSVVFCLPSVPARRIGIACMCATDIASACAAPSHTQTHTHVPMGTPSDNNRAKNKRKRNFSVCIINAWIALGALALLQFCSVLCVCVGESEWQRRLWVPPCQASTSLDYGLQQLDLGMNASHECRPGHLPSHSISDIDDDDDNDTGCKRNSRSPSPTLITTGRTKRKLHRRIMENCSKTSNNFHIAKMLYASVSNRPSSIRPLQNAECILATKRATSSRAKK